MINEFVNKWEQNKENVRKVFSAAHPDSYDDIIRIVIENITSDEYSDDLAPDPKRIHRIDDGDYQGTLLYIIAEKGYQPSDYYACFVGYGSCSGCDTLEGIREYSSDVPTAEQVNDYMVLALHVVQGLKKI